MRAFRSAAGGTVSAGFDDDELDLLADLCGQLIHLLGAAGAQDDDSLEAMVSAIGFGGSVVTDDPAIARLFPDAYPGDAEASEEFRRFTTGELARAKLSNARMVVETIEAARLGAGSPDPLAERQEVSREIEITPDGGWIWLRVIGDLRLVFATRLGIERADDEQDGAGIDEESAEIVEAIYDWLAFVQESLVNALDQLAGKH